MHDPRVGRFFAPDPLEKKYPWYTPYQFSGNRVIDMVELEGLEPDESGSYEGSTGYATDKNEESVYYSNPDPMCGGGVAPTDYLWIQHMGTPTTAAGWYKEANYKQIIQPFALQAASANGWEVGLTWQDAKRLIGSPGAPMEMSNELKTFLSDRLFDGTETGFYSGNGAVRDQLSDIGAHLINSANKAKYFSATGNITEMGLDSPFFGMGLGLKALATTSSEMVTVGQWMTAEELSSFTTTGIIPRTNVLTKGMGGYIKQASAGDIYVEFRMHSSLLVEKNAELGWSLVKSKNQMYIKLAEKKGESLLAPIGTDIKPIFTKQ